MLFIHDCFELQKVLATEVEYSLKRAEACSCYLLISKPKGVVNEECRMIFFSSTGGKPMNALVGGERDNICVCSNK
jgi:hypothetical protein